MSPLDVLSGAVCPSSYAIGPKHVNAPASNILVNSQIYLRHSRRPDQLRVPLVTKTVCGQYVTYKSAQLWNLNLDIVFKL